MFAVVNDYVINGRGHGNVGQQMEAVKWQNGLRRPYLKYVKGVPQLMYALDTGRRKYNTNTGREDPVYQEATVNEWAARGLHSPLTNMVNNATALRKEEWLQLDAQVLRAARYRLRFWADLSSANSFGGFNGMSKLILEHETMSDPGEAIVDMDGITDGRGDRPQFQLQGLPLPITHSDFWFSARNLAVSRNTGTPLDSTMGEAAGRRVAESVEKQAIGNNVGVVYGGQTTQQGGYGRPSQVYGLINFPSRVVKTGLHLPTVGGWTPNLTLADVLAMRDLLYHNKFYGPFMIYHSNDWDQYLDNDYILTGGNVATQTLRNRLRSIQGVQDVARLDYLFSTGTDLSHGGPGLEGVPAAGNPFTLIMIQMTPDVARAVNGMDITTVQWETKGGMQLNFKVLCIQVPQLRADFYGNCGILQATQ